MGSRNKDFMKWLRNIPELERKDHLQRMVSGGVLNGTSARAALKRLLCNPIVRLQRLDGVVGMINAAKHRNTGLVMSVTDEENILEAEKGRPVPLLDNPQPETEDTLKTLTEPEVPSSSASTLSVVRKDRPSFPLLDNPQLKTEDTLKTLTIPEVPSSSASTLTVASKDTPSFPSASPRKAAIEDRPLSPLASFGVEIIKDKLTSPTTSAAQKELPRVREVPNAVDRSVAEVDVTRKDPPPPAARISNDDVGDALAAATRKSNDNVHTSSNISSQSQLLARTPAESPSSSTVTLLPTGNGALARTPAESPSSSTVTLLPTGNGALARTPAESPSSSTVTLLPTGNGATQTQHELSNTATRLENAVDGSLKDMADCIRESEVLLIKLNQKIKECEKLDENNRYLVTLQILLETSALLRSKYKIVKSTLESGVCQSLGRQFYPRLLQEITSNATFKLYTSLRLATMVNLLQNLDDPSRDPNFIYNSFVAATLHSSSESNTPNVLAVHGSLNSSSSTGKPDVSTRPVAEAHQPKEAPKKPRQRKRKVATALHQTSTPVQTQLSVIKPPNSQQSRESHPQARMDTSYSTAVPDGTLALRPQNIPVRVQGCIPPNVTVSQNCSFGNRLIHGNSTQVPGSTNVQRCVQYPLSGNNQAQGQNYASVQHGAVHSSSTAHTSVQGISNAQSVQSSSAVQQSHVLYQRQLLAHSEIVQTQPGQQALASNFQKNPTSCYSSSYTSQDLINVPETNFHYSQPNRVQSVNTLSSNNVLNPLQFMSSASSCLPQGAVHHNGYSQLLHQSQYVSQPVTQNVLTQVSHSAQSWFRGQSQSVTRVEMHHSTPLYQCRPDPCQPGPPSQSTSQVPIPSAYSMIGTCAGQQSNPRPSGVSNVAFLPQHSSFELNAKVYSSEFTNPTYIQPGRENVNPQMIPLTLQDFKRLNEERLAGKRVLSGRPPTQFPQGSHHPLLATAHRGVLSERTIVQDSADETRALSRDSGICTPEPIPDQETSNRPSVIAHNTFMR